MNQEQYNRVVHGLRNTPYLNYMVNPHTGDAHVISTTGIYGFPHSRIIQDPNMGGNYRLITEPLDYRSNEKLRVNVHVAGREFEFGMGQLIGKR